MAATERHGSRGEFHSQSLRLWIAVLTFTGSSHRKGASSSLTPSLNLDTVVSKVGVVSAPELQLVVQSWLLAQIYRK